jgi:hypothetical protein
VIKRRRIWLHVRDDNFGAIKLYEELGFQEIARRTTWYANLDTRLTYPDTDIKIEPRHTRFWPLQQEWLRRVYPDELNWYHSWNTRSLRPGLWNWLYLLFFDSDVQQWAAVRNDKLLATQRGCRRRQVGYLYAATERGYPEARPPAPACAT